MRYDYHNDNFHDHDITAAQSYSEGNLDAVLARIERVMNDLVGDIPFAGYYCD